MKVEVRGDSALVEIEVVDYENSDALTVDDANWLLCFVRINIGGFSAQFQASFTTHDFQVFHQDLSGVLATLTGTASFQTYEDGLQLTVEIKGSGRAKISGAARRLNTPRVELSFSIDSDQSFLSQTLNQLSSIIRDFPVKTQIVERSSPTES